MAPLRVAYPATFSLVAKKRLPKRNDHCMELKAAP